MPNQLKITRPGRVVLGVVTLFLVDPALAQDGVFHEAEGVDLAYQYCTGCHSEMLVAQQGQSRDGWEKLFIWMVEEQGMPPIPEPDRTVLLDYLSEHYNTDRPNFPRP